MFHLRHLIRGALIVAACWAVAPQLAAAGSSLDLSRYHVTASFGAPKAESSAITYDWDSDTLFLVEDSARVISQITKTGTLVSEMKLAGFRDTEGLSYVGGGRFVLADERVQTISLITYKAGGTVEKSKVPSYSFGPDVGNVGIEGVSYDPTGGKYVAVKQEKPAKVYEATISFGARTSGRHVELFDPVSLGLQSLSDVQVLSMPWFAGTGFERNLLVLSAASHKLLEVDRSGKVVSSFDLTNIPAPAEGVTIDRDGNIYIASEGAGPKVITVLSPSER